MGRWDQAFAMIKRAHELDPLSPHIRRILAWHLSVRGQHEQAVELMRTAIELAPDQFLTHVYLGDIYLRRGVNKEAFAEYQKALDISAGNAGVRLILAHAYAVSGQRAKAEKILEELKAELKQANLPFLEIATVYAALGRKDEAFGLLEKAYQEHSGEMIKLKSYGKLEPLRSDPRFADLLRRVGFPPGEIRK